MEYETASETDSSCSETYSCDGDIDTDNEGGEVYPETDGQQLDWPKKFALRQKNPKIDIPLEARSDAEISEVLSDADVEETESDKEIELRAENSLVVTPLMDFVTKYGNRIYWAIHFWSSKETSELFPDGVQLTDTGLYGFKKLSYLFGNKVDHVLEHCEHNAFLRWLNQELGKKEKCVLDDFYKSEDPVFMNCADFVFFTLHTAKLISKDQIIRCYKHFIKDLQSKTRYYGFDLSKFQKIDLNEGTEWGQVHGIFIKKI